MRIGSIALCLMILVTGCAKKETVTPPQRTVPTPAASVSVTAIDLGRSLAADKSIGERTDSFRPADTIFASIGTEGSGTAKTLRARWTFQDGALIDESSQTISPSGSARTEFHVSKPDGWPVGRYRVEVTLDGNPAGAKEFTVQ